MSQLLMIDDDEKLVALTRDYLESHGFEVAAAHDGHAGVDAVLAAEPALVILDLMLPGIDGLEVCRRVRQTSRVPILMLTAKGDKTERIVGLELGDDDYRPSRSTHVSYLRGSAPSCAAVMTRRSSQAPRSSGSDHWSSISARGRSASAGSRST